MNLTSVAMLILKGKVIRVQVHLFFVVVATRFAIQSLSTDGQLGQGLHGGATGVVERLARIIWMHGSDSGKKSEKSNFAALHLNYDPTCGTHFRVYVRVEQAKEFGYQFPIMGLGQSRHWIWSETCGSLSLTTPRRRTW